MVVQSGRIGVYRGPRENTHRPSVDVLFRTAAHHFGPRVIGIVLSGALDDGSAGLAAVKTGGGIAVVQDPSDALVASMPQRALERTDVDYSLAVREIAPLLCALVAGAGELPDEAPLPEVPARVVPLETAEEATMSGEARRSDELGPPSVFTCPDCSGTLFEIREGKGIRFRCRVGHAYSEETIVAAQNDAVERALWTALRALEEREALTHKMAEYARRRGFEGLARRFDEKSAHVHEDVSRVHDLIVNGRALEPVAAEQDHDA
jgi:two-component system chemotaxis response regulator CheB